MSSLGGAAYDFQTSELELGFHLLYGKSRCEMEPHLTLPPNSAKSDSAKSDSAKLDSENEGKITDAK